MVLIPVRCPQCHSDQVIKGGVTKASKQRYRCQNLNCPRYSFVLDPSYQGHLPEVKEQIIDIPTVCPSFTPPWHDVTCCEYNRFLTRTGSVLIVEMD